MLRKPLLIIGLMIMFSGVAFAHPKYSIKTMTPEVMQALDARKARFAELRTLKSSGMVGENNHGYVQVLNSDANASSLVEQENQDRKIIYTTIAQQNGLEGALSTIESAFAQVQRDKAEAGDKIQTEEGNWITK